MLGMTLFIGGFNAAKMASLAILLSASPLLTAAWLFVECAAFLGLRMLTQEGQWRGSASGTDGFGISLVVHVVYYAGMLAAPLPMGRHPSCAGPRAYSILVVYSLAINSVIMTVGFQIDRSDGGRNAIATSEPMMRLVLLTATAVALCGAMVTWRYMNEDHRSTFYRHESLQQQMDWMWENRTTAPRGSGRDAARAHLLITASWRYWPPTDKVKAWLSQWEEWEREPPEWFTPWWRRRARRFPRGFLPDVARERLERERAEFRRSRREQQQPQQNSHAPAAATETRPVASIPGVSPQAKHSRTAVHPFP